MIKVRLTKNYAGVEIEGNYDDLYELYDNINSFIKGKECKNELEEDMRLHLLGFLYEVRHAYQGSRDIYVVDNGLTDEDKVYYGIAKSVKKNVLYSFNYAISEIFTDVILIKHFINKSSKNLFEFDVDYNNVMSFYGKVIDSLKEILSESELSEVKMMLTKTNLQIDEYLPQYFNFLNIKYLKMTKDQRKNQIISVLNNICNSNKDEDFVKIKKEVLDFAKENNLKISEVEYGKYPSEIKW